MSPPNAPEHLADGMIVGASITAFCLFGSDERRFQQRVHTVTYTAKCWLPSFCLGSQIAVHRSPTFAPWIAGQEASR